MIRLFTGALACHNGNHIGKGNNSNWKRKEINKDKE